MKNYSHFELLVRVFIRELRQNLTQDKLCEMMGYDYNIVSRWEVGSRKLNWSEFILITKALKLDLNGALFKIFHLKLSKMPTQKEVMAAFDNSSIDSIKKHYSSQKIRRLKLEVTQLKLSEFLHFIEIAHGRAERFVNFFVNAKESKNLSKLFDPVYEYFEALKKDFNFLLLRQGVGLTVYKKDPEKGLKFLSEITGLTHKEVLVRLDLLCEFGVLKKTDQSYEQVKSSLDTGASDREVSLFLNQKLRKKVVDFCATEKIRPEKHKSSFLVFASNTELEKRVFELSRKYYVDLKNLVSEYEKNDNDRISSVLIDLYSLTE